MSIESERQQDTTGKMEDDGLDATASQRGEAATASPDPASIPLPSDDGGLRRRTGGGSTSDQGTKESSSASDAGSRMRSPLMEKLKLPPMPSLQIPSGIEVKSVTISLP